MAMAMGQPPLLRVQRGLARRRPLHQKETKEEEEETKAFGVEEKKGIALAALLLPTVRGAAFRWAAGCSTHLRLASLRRLRGDRWQGAKSPPEGWAEAKELLLYM